MNKKILITSVIIAIVAATGVICTIHPQMHKQFSISIIDYLLKFNTDGTVTTTKQTTTTVIKEGND